MPRSRHTRNKSNRPSGLFDGMTREKIDRLRLRALMDYGRGKLDATLADADSQAGRIYRSALYKLEDQVEAKERKVAASLIAKSGGKLVAGTILAPAEGS